MLEEAKRREDVNAILVHDLSRFSRDSLRAQILTRELEAAGVRVLSVTDPVIDPKTSSGVYMKHITLAKNEALSRDISFHTRKGCRANVQTRDPVTGWCYKNGGQPLWGYKAVRLDKGEDSKGRPIYKMIWELDDTEIAGKPLHEWVKHCLMMAAEGASLNMLRDFCNEKGFPARRKSHWGISTWNALLQPHVLMKYCGFEVWNVHRKKGTKRLPEEWVIVENAHPAILIPEEAKQIIEARRQQSGKANGLPKGRSRNSRYLLSGGLFKCGRCGANMTGLKGTSGTHYVCGSLPYRRGKGCGKGVYVPVKLIENEAIRGLREMVSDCTDPKGFARLVNEELKRIWEQQNGPDLEAKRKLESVEKKIANVRQAIEDGINDAEWANSRLTELTAERQRLQVQIQPRLQVQIQDSTPPKVNVEQAMVYRKDVEKLFAVEGATEEKKKLLRIWMQDIKLAPESLEITLTYRLPEPVMNRLVAGAHFVANHDAIRSRLQRRVALPLNGRHTLPQRRDNAPTLARVARSTPTRLLSQSPNRNGPQTRLSRAASLGAVT
jgi:hypothetical protein